MEIQISEEDISKERSRSDNPQLYSDAYVESLAVYRQIAERMAERNIFLFHGSAVSVDGKGYVFTAKSGVGKSTHAALWQKRFRERFSYVNDDKPLIAVHENPPVVTVYGTPWDGKHHRSENQSAPLSAICVINRGKENQIVRLSGKDAFSVMLQQTYLPEKRELQIRRLQWIDQVIHTIPLYSLNCTISEEAVEVAYEGMNRDEDT